MNTESEPRRAVPQVQTSLLQDAEERRAEAEWQATLSTTQATLLRHIIWALVSLLVAALVVIGRMWLS